MRIVGYARVSSREQAENSHALEQQKDRLKREGGVSEILEDVASGSKDDRPSFKKLMDLVKEGKVHRVVVTRLDRLSRSVPTSRKVIDEFQKFGVDFVSLGESIDTSTSIGKFQINLLASLAEMEVDRLSERVKHGWQHFRDNARAINPPFGYRKVGDKFELDHSEFLCLIDGLRPMTKAEIALDMIEIFFKFQGLRAAIKEINLKYGIRRFNYDKGGGFIVRDLFRWSPTGLSTWLQNPVLRGHTCYLKVKDKKRQDPSKWDIHYNTHPEHVLLTEQQLLEMEQILSKNKQVRSFGNSEQRHPLAGLVYCAECRSSCYSVSGNRGKQPGYNFYFQCKNWRLRACTQKTMVRMEKIEDDVVQALVVRANELATTIDNQKTEDEVPNLRLQELEQQLKGVEALGGFNPALENAKREIRNQIKYIENQQKASASEELVTQEELVKCFSNPHFWQSKPSEKEKTRIFNYLVRAVWLKDGKVQNVDLTV